MITKSSNFIKMCGQAKEIQKGHIWKDSDKLAYRRCINVRDCDYEELIKHPEYYEMTYGTRKVFGTIDIDKPIYLPTQEQLQEMILPIFLKRFSTTHALRNDSSFIYRMIIEKFQRWINRSSPSLDEYMAMFSSLNELWLAFVMHEKYNKIWDGKDWKKWKE